MSNLDVFLDLKKYYLMGSDLAKDGKNLNKILDHVVDTKVVNKDDDDEEVENITVRDLDSHFQAAVFMGYAYALEDILKEFPSWKVLKARQKVFHLD